MCRLSLKTVVFYGETGPRVCTYTRSLELGYNRRDFSDTRGKSIMTVPAGLIFLIEAHAPYWGAEADVVRSSGEWAGRSIETDMWWL